VISGSKEQLTSWYRSIRSINAPYIVPQSSHQGTGHCEAYISRPHRLSTTCE
jgi:hypothetical protein